MKAPRNIYTAPAEESLLSSEVTEGAAARQSRLISVTAGEAKVLATTLASLSFAIFGYAWVCLFAASLTTATMIW